MLPDFVRNIWKEQDFKNLPDKATSMGDDLQQNSQAKQSKRNLLEY